MTESTGNGAEKDAAADSKQAMKSNKAWTATESIIDKMTARRNERMSVWVGLGCPAQGG